MAVVLHSLRLWLLLFNLYGTFKAMKPPLTSGRSTRNGQGLSLRAMQLRKRELKSRLAVWVVWAALSIMERPLDYTIGFFIPFYNELKCTVLFFLLVSRSRGAEAIFLHIIHPSLRPYVPAVDRVLTALHSIFDLLALVSILPWEYVSNRWHRWSWRWSWKRKAEPALDAPRPEDIPSKPLDKQRRPRPRQESQHTRMKEANKQAQVIFQEIEGAQNRVRIQTRSQSAKNNTRTQPVRIRRAPDHKPAGSSTGRQVLKHPYDIPEEVWMGPGSRPRGVHHLDSQLAKDTTTQLAYPHPAEQPGALTQPIRISAPSSSNHPGHEIWYPPQTSPHYRRRSTTLDDTGRRTPSPVYPPLPSAYHFTPRRSESPPAPPRIVAPPDLVSPTPRRVSTTVLDNGTFDAFDGIDQFPEQRPGDPGYPKDSISSKSLGNQQPHIYEAMVTDDFFGPALEPTIRTGEVGMDVKNLLMRDGSSANEVPKEEARENQAGLRGMTNRLPSGTRETTRNTAASTSNIKKSKPKPEPKPESETSMEPGPLRRSSRTRNDRDRSSSVETDEFGFTIRHNSSALESTSIDPKPSSSRGKRPLAAPVSSKTKPLARTKPAVKPTQQERGYAESSDEESVKKRRKVKPGSKQVPSANGRARPVKTSLQSVKNEGKARLPRKKAMAQSTEPVDDVKDRQLVVRATRTSTKPPLDAKKEKNLRSVNDTLR